MLRVKLFSEFTVVGRDPTKASTITTADDWSDIYMGHPSTSPNSIKTAKYFRVN